MNVKIKRQIQHLWFIKELLQNILTTKERCFLSKTHNAEFVEFELKNYRSYCQPHSVLIKLFAEVFVECEVKPDEDIKAL